MSSGADDWSHVYDADSEDEDEEESDNESDQMRQPGGGEHQRPRTTIELATGEDRSGSNEEQNGTDYDSGERMEVDRQLHEEEEEVFQAAAALVSIHRNEVALAANRTERNKRFQCTFEYCEFETDDFEEIIEHIRHDHFGSRSIVQGREVYDFIAENEQQSGDDEMVVDEDAEVVGEDDESRRWGKQPKDRPPQVTENQSNLIQKTQNESSDSEPSSSSFANYFKAKAEHCQR